MKAILSLLAVTYLVTSVLGQSVQFCSPEGICMALTIPGVQGGPDGPDLFATIKAPAAHKWFAIGFGQQMTGTLMLVCWPWQNQVVVSARLAKGHALPPPYAGPQVSILKSTITSTDSTVELKCSNCTVWTTGKLDIQATSANFIYAYSTTAPSQLSNPNSPFQQHSDHGNFQLNLKNAITSNAPTGAPALTGSTPAQTGFSQRQIIILIHAIIMGIVWVILFPLGAITIRFLGTMLKTAVGKHRAIQITTLVLLCCAVAVGFYLAVGHQFTLFHHFFGVGILAAAIIQAFFGWYHHHRYVKDKPKSRRWFTHVHLWLGRTVIICGLANCGFGLLAANQQLKWAIIWWIGSGVLVAMYFGAYIIWALIQKRARPKPGPGGYNRLSTPGSYGQPPYGAREEVFELNNPDQPSPRYTGGGYGPQTGYVPPREEVPGKYEPHRYDQERFVDRAPEPYDPPRRFEEPVQRFGSPGR